VSFEAVWTEEAAETYNRLKSQAESARNSRSKSGKAKSSREEGLFKQVAKCIQMLLENPRHPALQTHEFGSLSNPYSRKEKVFEAYAQQGTPAAYRVFWCYGPAKGKITVLAITSHP